MTKLIETLKNNGWIESTLGECQVGDEVLLTPAGPVPRAMRVTQPARWVGEKVAFVNTSDGGAHRDTTPVLRAPRPKRPEYAPGTVALITWDEGDDHVRDLLPVRAMMSVEGVWHGVEIDPPGESDRIEVVRVLLPADQDTPTVEVTDEMVERAAEAMYLQDYGPGWDEYPMEDEKEEFRELAREVIKAALGVEK